VTLHPLHKRFLWLDQGVVGFAINVGINYGIARVVFGSLKVVPPTGDPSLATDTLVTAFVLPFLVALIVGWVTRSQVKAGKLPVPDWTRADWPLLRWLPDHTGRRAMVLGGIGVLVFGIPLSWLLGEVYPQGMDPAAWCWLKGLIAGVLAAWVGPLSALATLGDLGSAGADTVQ
jgi:hypothetical protein